MMPPRLARIVAFFEPLAELERRENLVAYAGRARRLEPRPGEHFAVADVRRDAECTDTVGIFLRVDEKAGVHFRITLGPEVQTLTRALAAILCEGLDGSSAKDVLELPEDFVPKIVGAQLIRQRSQTVYYLLRRMKAAVRQQCGSGLARP